MPGGSEPVLRASAEPEVVDRVHALLEELWEAWPEVGEVDRIRFGTAVAELVANVVQHAGATTVELRLDGSPGEVAAHLTDDGQPLPPGALEAGWPDDDAEDGRGLAMARAASSALSYRRDGATNRWTVVVRPDRAG